MESFERQEGNKKAREKAASESHRVVVFYIHSHRVPFILCDRDTRRGQSYLFRINNLWPNNFVVDESLSLFFSVRCRGLGLAINATDGSGFIRNFSVLKLEYITRCDDKMNEMRADEKNIKADNEKKNFARISSRMNGASDLIKIYLFNLNAQSKDKQFITSSYRSG